MLARHLAWIQLACMSLVGSTSLHFARKVAFGVHDTGDTGEVMAGSTD